MSLTREDVIEIIRTYPPHRIGELAVNTLDCDTGDIATFTSTNGTITTFNSTTGTITTLNSTTGTITTLNSTTGNITTLNTTTGNITTVNATTVVTTNLTLNSKTITYGDFCPIGTIVGWTGGYYDSDGDTYSNELPTSASADDCDSYVNTATGGTWRVCKAGLAPNSGTAPFDTASKYVPNLTDDRFLMGDASIGDAAGVDNPAYTSFFQNQALTWAHNHVSPIGTMSKTAPYHDLSFSLAYGFTSTTIARYDCNSSTAPVSDGSYDRYQLLTSTPGNFWNPTGAGGGDYTGIDNKQDWAAAGNFDKKPHYLPCMFIIKVK